MKSLIVIECVLVASVAEAEEPDFVKTFPCSSSTCLYSEGGSLISGGEQCVELCDANGKVTSEKCEPCPSRIEPWVTIPIGPEAKVLEWVDPNERAELLSILERALEFIPDYGNGPVMTITPLQTDKEIKLRQDIEAMIRRLK